MAGAVARPRGAAERDGHALWRCAAGGCAKSRRLRPLTSSSSTSWPSTCEPEARRAHRLPGPLHDLVSRDGPLGIVVVAATQKPGHEIVPTWVRDLFAFRMALRCTTPDASDTVLGQGWAKEGYSDCHDPWRQSGRRVPPRRGITARQDAGLLSRRSRDLGVGCPGQRLSGARDESRGSPAGTWCTGGRRGVLLNPVRLAGSRADPSTGEITGGAITVACKDRRAAVCPACSRFTSPMPGTCLDGTQRRQGGARIGAMRTRDCSSHSQRRVLGPSTSRHGGDAAGACRPRRDPTRCSMAGRLRVLKFTAE